MNEKIHLVDESLTRATGLRIELKYCYYYAQNNLTVNRQLTTYTRVQK